MATLHTFFLVTTTILFALLLLLRFRRVRGDGRRLPPGPPSLLLLFSAAWLGLTSSPAEAEPLLQRLVRRYGPIVSLRVGSRLAIFLRRLADDGEAPAPVTPSFQYAVFYLLLIMCFGERLDEKVVRAIAAAQHEQVRYMFGKMSVFAFLPSVAEHLFRGRVRKMLSLRRRQKELFLPLIDARREYKDKKRGGEREPRRSKSGTTLEHSYVDTLFDVRLPEEGNRRLTDDEMVNLCSEFLTAGADTTSTALHWIMAELVKNQAVQQRLYEEIKAKTKDGHEEVSEEDIQNMPYLKAVVLEGLRKHPPVHFVLPHMAAEDVEVGGYLVPKGATVNFMVAEMGRDEREWEKPMEFIPERFLEGEQGVDMTGSTGIRMMPFGVGRRICAGLNIAVLHLLYLVANMVREFEWKEAAGHEVDLAEKLEFMVVMKKELRPRLVPRKPNMQTEEHL
ncbi:hypothetical protein VPH35_004784 [Triticum aestivum]